MPEVWQAPYGNVNGAALVAHVSTQHDSPYHIEKPQKVLSSAQWLSSTSDVESMPCHEATLLE